MKTYLIRLYGIVQGVGFRPFVKNLADSYLVKGTVSNKGSYVEIYAQGENAENFMSDLTVKNPERSIILKKDVKTLDLDKYSSFEIIGSEHETGDIFVSPDIATCPECKRELYDKTNRRYLHPFINCTQCGPRLTILDSMPYDRERTSMAVFPMCEKCEKEYYDPSSRRFDAQPVCCNDCGPKLYIVGKDITGLDAVRYSRELIMSGKIVAVKGIGGFHLCCDAKNSEAVIRLRKLKNRPQKPFAVMMKDMETAEKYCEISKEEKKLLDSYQKPIILLKKKKSFKFEAVAPGNPFLGVMLPYAPVQMLLFSLPNSDSNNTVADDGMTDCFVMTSGNVSGAPICRDDETALEEIGSFCDAVLSHDRKIRIRADDSVVSFFFGKPYMIRRSRGYAPLPVITSFSSARRVLAIGGELKNTFCLAQNDMYYMSPYVGDLADIRTVNALEETVGRMEELLEIEPDTVVCDKHPLYNSVSAAEKTGLPLVRVQHHYAHILSCMAENDLRGAVLGISFDGTGYGDDKTVWGGEFFVCDEKNYKRAGHISPFYQVGGDLSAKEGFRIAAAMTENYETAEKLGLCDKKTFDLIKVCAQKNINSVKSTSAGRLFDAVSAILGIKRKSTFESEAASSLQSFAETDSDGNITDLEPCLSEKDIEKYSFLSGRGSDGLCEAKTDIIFKDITNKALENYDRHYLASLFHKMLASSVVNVCINVREKSRVNRVCLSGGVFQNIYFLSLVKSGLEKSGFDVYIHSLIPPNDGGIALGQAYYGMNM